MYMYVCLNFTTAAILVGKRFFLFKAFIPYFFFFFCVLYGNWKDKKSTFSLQ